MARTALSAEPVVPAGLEATYTAAIADGHMFDNDGKILIHVVNESAGAVVVTVPTTSTQDGDLALPDRTVSIAAGTDQFIGPFRPHIYNQLDSSPDAGMVYVDYDVTASITIAVLEVG